VSAAKINYSALPCAQTSAVNQKFISHAVTQKDGSTFQLLSIFFFADIFCHGKQIDVMLIVCITER